VRVSVFHAQYVTQARELGERRRAAETELGIALKKLIPGKKIEKIWDARSDRQHRHYVFPPLAECRASFERAIGTTIEWDRGCERMTSPPITSDRRTGGLGAEHRLTNLRLAKWKQVACWESRARRGFR